MDDPDSSLVHLLKSDNGPSRLGRLKEALDSPFFLDDYEQYVQDPALHINGLYSPLSPQGQIRLISVLPTLSAHNIYTKLEIVDLKENHDYDALSWLWGAGHRDTRDVAVNGHQAKVPTNLIQFLHTMAVYPEALSRRVWVDYLCIDQTNNEERGWQVNQMSSIYQQAHEVTIWMGPAAQHDQTAIHLLRQLHLEGFQSMASMTMPCSENFRTLVQEIERMPDGWSSIQKILEHPWWLRMWTIQESVLAPNAKFIFGHMSLYMNTLEGVISLSSVIEDCANRSCTSKSRFSELKESTAWNAALARCMTRADLHEGRRINLLSLLYRFSNNKAS